MKTLHAEAAAKIQCGLARKCDFEKLSLDDIKAIKSDNSITHYRFGEHAVRAAEPDDPESRTFLHVASSEHVDSMQDVIKAGGWDTTRLKTGRIPLQWGHDSYPVPMGLVLSANKRAKCEDGIKCLETKSRFHEASVYGDSDWGKTVESIFTLVARGDLPGVSVGFVPKAYHWPEQEERDALGMAAYGMVFDEQELLELSVTPIPANSRANLRKSMGQMKEALASMVAAGTIDEATSNALLAQLEPSHELFMLRARALSKSVVPLSSELPWIKGSKPVDDSAPSKEKTAAPLSDETKEAIRQEVKEHVSVIAREVRAELRRSLFAVTREILEPVETAITEAADELEDVATRLGLGRKDSERAEVSRESAATATSATSAASTGTSRDNPTTPTESKAGELLLKVLDPTYVGADTAHGSSRTRS